MKINFYWKHFYFVFLFSITLITGCGCNSVPQDLLPSPSLPATITSPVTPDKFPLFEKLSPGQYVVYPNNISSNNAMYGFSPETGIQEKYSDFSGMPVSPDGLWYLLGYSMLYNSMTGDILDFSSAMSGNQCFVFGSSPDVKYVTLFCDGELYVLSLNSGAMINIGQRVSEDDVFHPPHWSPDGKWIAYIKLVTNPDYGPNAEAQLFLVDTSCLGEPSSCSEKMRGPIEGNFYLAISPYGWSPDSKYLAIPAFGHPGILIYNIETNEIQILPYQANSVAWSPDGNWLAFEGYSDASPSEEIFIVPTDGGEPIQITSEGDLDSSVLFWVKIP